MSEERVRLSVEEALQRIGDADEIHTFRTAGSILIGAHWERAQLIVAMAYWGIEEAGEQASSMNHSLVLIDDHGPLFIETVPR